MPSALEILSAVISPESPMSLIDYKYESDKKIVLILERQEKPVHLVFEVEDGKIKIGLE